MTGNIGTSRAVQVSGESFTKAVQIEVKMASPEKPWNVQLGIPLTDATASAGDVLLLSFMARSVQGGARWCRRGQRKTAITRTRLYNGRDDRSREIR